MIFKNSKIIGFELNSVIESLDNDMKYEVQITKTPLKNKIEERINKEPIVIKYKEEGNMILLTASYFK